ncbi:hypothetical protein [Nocardioides sp. SYSU DS0663]|uniref:hypothetical protein n=1 Tax=Nocardioides sp. SYSU DS0663 TaxID=3416445 RepID=UPI003F4C4930
MTDARRGSASRRTTTAIAVAVVAVVGVTAGVALVVGATGTGNGANPRDAAVAGSSAADLPPSTLEDFACARASKVFTGEPPLPDEAEQQEIVEAVEARGWTWVRHVATTALGVVALVDDPDGDADHTVDEADERARELRRLGVAHVSEWDPSGVDVGLDAAAQARQVVQWRLDPVVRELRRKTRGLAGDAGLALWHAAGAVLVQWKAPVPAEVEALAGIRPDGVRVVVEPVPYSQADVDAAQHRLRSWLRRSGRDHAWTSASACADGSGIVVGMEPPLEDRSALQAELAEAAGMPVLVVPEEAPVPAVMLVPTPGS